MRPIKGYEGIYEISETGRVFNCQTGQELKGNVNSYGYRVIALTKNGRKKDKKLHRLLVEAFIPNPNNYDCVNHIDGDKLNNSLDNLEWCTKGYNNRHAREQLSLDFSIKPVIQTTLSGEVVAVWVNASRAASVLNGEPLLISACCRDTAKTAYGYKWYYADDSDFFFREIQKYLIREKIKQLSEQLSQL